MEQVIIRAVAGVLKSGNCVLMATRPIGKTHANSWEFPGGKIEVGETSLNALVRELNEEIGVVVDTRDCEFLTYIETMYPDSLVQLDVFVVNKWQKIVVPLEGQIFYWYKLSDICTLEPLLSTTQKILDLLICNLSKDEI